MLQKNLLSIGLVLIVVSIFAGIMFRNGTVEEMISRAEPMVHRKDHESGTTLGWTVNDLHKVIGEASGCAFGRPGLAIHDGFFAKDGMLYEGWSAPVRFSIVVLPPLVTLVVFRTPNRASPRFNTKPTVIPTDIVGT